MSHGPAKHPGKPARNAQLNTDQLQRQLKESRGANRDAEQRIHKLTAELEAYRTLLLFHFSSIPLNHPAIKHIR